MSSMIKVFLLLAVMVCISKAHENQCLCQRVRANLIGKSPVKDIQIYPATIFCDRVEIVVTTSNNFRYCLNPSLDKVKRLLNKIM
uniref:Chemokine interleukin-8-like domain-containing protein n=1 Tax=Monopterus albus TaxID=43700 RepID=A0A3Q3QV26_MONAL